MQKSTNQKVIFNWWKYLIVIGLLIIAFGFGCKFDFEISKNSYYLNKHWELGRLFSNILLILNSFIVSTALFTLVFSGLKYKNKNKALGITGIVFAIIGIIAFIAGQYSGCKEWSCLIKTTPLLIINILLTLMSLSGSFCLSFFVFRKKVNDKYFRILFTFICAIAIAGILKELLTILWSRPRPQRVFSSVWPLHEFKPVWQPRPSVLVHNYSATLKSFPSGHTLVSCIMLGIISPLYELKIIKKKSIIYSLLIISLLQIGLMSSMRIVGGKHFLTDATIGAIIGASVCYFSSFFWNKNIKA